MVSIILVNWNSRPFLRSCMTALEAQTYQPFELLVIDNCSTDGSQDLLRTAYSHHHLCLNERNVGYCGGANQGIRLAQGEYLLVMNPDVIVSQDFLLHLVQAAERDQTAGACSGKLLRFDRQTLDSAGQFLRPNLLPVERGYDHPDNGQYERSEYIFSVCGAVAFYRRTMIEDIRLDDGYFDETYFAFYEDLDLGWRAQLFGWKTLYVPQAIACHYRGGGLRDSETRTDCPQSNAGRMPALQSGQKPRAPQHFWFERVPFLPSFSFMKKPAFIQRHIIVNRYLTIIKNASWQDILWGFPAILKCDILLWGFVICARPTLLATLGTLFKLFPHAIKKRRYIQRRKIVSSSYIRQFIRQSL